MKCKARTTNLLKQLKCPWKVVRLSQKTAVRGSHLVQKVAPTGNVKHTWWFMALMRRASNVKRRSSMAPALPQKSSNQLVLTRQLTGCPVKIRQINLILKSRIKRKHVKNGLSLMPTINGRPSSTSSSSSSSATPASLRCFTLHLRLLIMISKRRLTWSSKYFSGQIFA